MYKKVVVLGGGTGMSYLLRGLKDFPLDITSVITVSDNGSSTGTLRHEFHLPAVGDIRKVMTSLSGTDQNIKDLMEYRFDTFTDLNGHPIGNLILVGMYNITGSLKESIAILGKLLNLKSKVLPLSEDNLTLMAESINGEIIEGESEITDAHKRYKRLFYKEKPKVLKDVITSLEDADFIILSMGSLCTSVLPHLICEDVVNAIDKSKAKLLYICNAMTQPGETDNFGVSDHVNLLNSYLNNKKIDAVIASNSKISDEVINKYHTEEEKERVFIDNKNIEDIGCELLEGDLITLKDGTLKHDSLKLATLVFSYVMRD